MRSTGRVNGISGNVDIDFRIALDSYVSMYRLYPTHTQAVPLHRGAVSETAS